MSITPIRELERLEVAYLTAKVAYEYAIQRSAVAWDERDKYHEARDALMRAVTLDTIRALLDVAQAGADVITYIEKTVAEFERGYDSAFHTDTLGTTDWARTSMSFDMWEFIRLRKAIDSLVKEATDE